jgi:rare lipoprotein A
VTKRKPSSYKWQWRVAALVCGLFLLNGWSPVWAASKKPLRQAAHAKHGKKHARTTSGNLTSAPEFGPADLLDDGVPGLRGDASFYGKKFHGRRTSTGERFDSRQFTAASNRFPLGTLLAVRRMDNDRCAIVKVNDRMHPKHRKRVIDVSRSVAEYLDMIRAGVVFVSVAPLKDGGPSRGSTACQAAFEPACADCAQAPERTELHPAIDD